MKDEKNRAGGPAGDPASMENPMSPENRTKRGMDVIRSEGKYPVYAIIMCAGAAIGHLLGTYVFEDLMTCTSLGMGAGIVAAFVYSRRRKDGTEEK